MSLTLDSILDGIIARKELLCATSQQISDASGVSKSTVDRMLRKQDGYIPNVQNLLDVAAAVGYEFQSREPEPVQTNDPHLRQLIYVYEKRCETLEKENRLKTVQSNMLLAEKDRTIASKNRWISRLSGLLIVLTFGIILVLAVDIAVRGIGWFR